MVEHRIARMMQLGMRQARYCGRHKTLFQALTTAAVANLTLIAGKVGLLPGAEISLAVVAYTKGRRSRASSAGTRHNSCRESLKLLHAQPPQRLRDGTGDMALGRVPM